MGDLVIRLGLDIAALRGDVGKANAEMNRFFSSVDKSMRVMKSAFIGLGAGIAGALSVRALTSAIGDVIDKADELGETVQKLGVNAEEFQKLSYAAQQSGASSEQLGQSIKALSKNMQELGDKGSKAGQALRAMGVVASDDATTVLKKMADTFAQMPDGVTKTALAMELLGKSGAELIPTLNQGSEGLKRMGEEVEALGGVMSGRFLKAAGEFNDELDKLRVVGGAAVKQLTAGMLPALKTIVEAIRDLVKTGGLEEWGRAVGEMALNLTGVFMKLAATFKALARINEGLSEAAELVQQGAPGDAILAVKQAVADVDALEAHTNKKLAKMREDFAANRKAMQETMKDTLDRAPYETDRGKDTERKFAAILGGDDGSEKAAAKAAREREQAEQRLLKLEERNAREAVEIQRRASEEELKIYLDGLEEQEKASKRLYELEAKNREEATEKAREESEKQLKVFLEGLEKAEAESRQFQEIFTNNLGDALTDLVTGAKSLSDAFKDMTDSIVQSITRIAAQKVAESIFGTREGGGGWMGDIVKGIFGGGFKFAAGGGSFGAGQPMVVGERGPEIIVPSSAGSVVPNHALGGTVNVTVNVPPITDRRTADQAAASVGMAVQRAMKRNQ